MMKKWVGICLTISLTVSVASAAWWPFGAGKQKSVTNETPSASAPAPRVSPRIFTDPAGRAMPAQTQKPVHQHSPQCGHCKPDSAGK